MYTIIVIIVRAIAAVVMKLINSFRAAKSAAQANGLCNTCVNVHNVKGYGGKELVFCNYTSELRAIKFAVCECSGYRDKNVAPPARVVGFVQIENSNNKEAFPAAVIRIGR